MSPAEWDDLPWQYQRMFIEGLEAEGLVEGGGGSSTGSTATDDFGALDALMQGAQTRRAGRERDGRE
jgi:hypothetical protein